MAVKVEGIKSEPTEKQPPNGGPVAQMTADANRVEYIVDRRGRRIGCKKLTFLDTHRITCLLADDASNTAALSQALMIASVVDIDGDPVRLPVKRSELHVLMARLDFEGVEAATKAMQRFGPVGGDDDEPIDERDVIKN